MFDLQDYQRVTLPTQAPVAYRQQILDTAATNAQCCLVTKTNTMLELIKIGDPNWRTEWNKVRYINSLISVLWDYEIPNDEVYEFLPYDDTWTFVVHNGPIVNSSTNVIIQEVGFGLIPTIDLGTITYTSLAEFCTNLTIALKIALVSYKLSAVATGTTVQLIPLPGIGATLNSATFRLTLSTDSSPLPHAATPDPDARIYGGITYVPNTLPDGCLSEEEICATIRQLEGVCSDCCT